MKTSTAAILIALGCFAYGTLMAYFAQYWTPHIIVGTEEVFGPYIWTWMAYGFGLLLLVGALIIYSDERKASRPPPPPPAPGMFPPPPPPPPTTTCPKCGEPLTYSEETHRWFCKNCVRAKGLLGRVLYGKQQESQSKGQAT